MVGQFGTSPAGRCLLFVSVFEQKDTHFCVHLFAFLTGTCLPPFIISAAIPPSYTRHPPPPLPTTNRTFGYGIISDQVVPVFLILTVSSLYYM
ncbi:hypothetical protein CC2G_010765 [Coprinopsis cinerea AmutBmut pab1-1]|nr:hypothetical protein CC2G_010765 [Coprinopsis cinerea AmutBmut pab1-1]